MTHHRVYVRRAVNILAELREINIAGRATREQSCFYRCQEVSNNLDPIAIYREVATNKFHHVHMMNKRDTIIAYDIP